MILEKNENKPNVVTGKSTKEADEELEMENKNAKKKYQQPGTSHHFFLIAVQINAVTV